MSQHPPQLLFRTLSSSCLKVLCLATAKFSSPCWQNQNHTTYLNYPSAYDYLWSGQNQLQNEHISLQSLVSVSSPENPVARSKCKMCLEGRHSLISWTIRDVCIPFSSHHLLSSVTLCSSFPHAEIQNHSFPQLHSTSFQSRCLFAKLKDFYGWACLFTTHEGPNAFLGTGTTTFVKLSWIFCETTFKFYDPTFNFTGDKPGFSCMTGGFPLILDLRENNHIGRIRKVKLNSQL